MNVRNACIIALMLYSGLEISEVVSLDKDNIFLAQSLIKVFGKEHKEHTTTY